MMDADFSHDGYKADIQRIIQQKQSATRWAVAFVFAFPPLMFTAAFAGVISWGSALPSLIAPIFYVTLMFFSGTLTRDNWWTFVRGTLAFARRDANDNEVTAWVDERYGIDRVQKFSSHAFLFRHAKDAVMFKLTWS